MKSKKKNILYIIAAIIFILTGIVIFYVNDDYDATDEAMLALETTENVQVEGEDPVHFYPVENAQTEVGIIFYPGGKVEEEAYAPLMQSLAGEGFAVFLVNMPLGLAVFDINGADGIIADHEEISDWYLMGHSLGGSIAAVYAGKNEKLAGLILLAAYSTEDLSNRNLPVLAIFGSEDQVINAEKVDEYRPMLPSTLIETTIEGGNHAQFGNYGIQKGDGEASITTQEQQMMTVDAITQFIQED